MKGSVFKIVFFLFVVVVMLIIAMEIYLQFWGGLDSGCTNCFAANADLDKLKSLLERSNRNYSISSVEETAINIGLNQKVVSDFGLDPWGNVYHYSLLASDGSQCSVVWTFGSDNAPGGEGPAEDIFRALECKNQQSGSE